MVAGHDLVVDGGHEVEVVRAEGAGDPASRARTVAAEWPRRRRRSSRGGRLGVVVGGVGIGAAEDGHGVAAAVTSSPKTSRFPSQALR